MFKLCNKCLIGGFFVLKNAWSLHPPGKREHYLKGSELENKTTAHKNLAAKSLWETESSSLYKQAALRIGSKRFQIAWEFGCLCGRYSKQLQKWLCIPTNHLGRKITAKLTFCVQEVKLLTPVPYFLSFLQNSDCQQCTLSAITLQHIGKKTTLRLMCPQMQVLSEILSCFEMINVTIFSVHHLVRMQRVQKKNLLAKGYSGLPFLETCPELGL